MPATPLVHRARRARPVGSTGLGSDFRPTLLVTAAVSIARPRSIPLGRLMLVADSPTGRLRPSPASLWSPPCPATTGNRLHRNDDPLALFGYLKPEAIHEDRGQLLGSCDLAV